MAGDDTDRGRILQGGEFYSPVRETLRTEDVLLSELNQPTSRRVPRHEHELAYVTIVLRGDYLEGWRRLEELHPMTAVFNPAGISHETIIGPKGAFFFTIEFRDSYLRQLGVELPYQTTSDRGPAGMLWAGLRLFSAFRTKTPDPLAIESGVTELLGAASGFRSAEKKVPRWLGRVKDRLREEFCTNLRMRDLANEAGVHPVHLARVFRAVERQTPGDYLQRLRVQAACQLLRDPRYPLAAIAAECGFADQSHLTRVFRRLTSTTPAKFRQTVAARA